jgi:XTP/dITP diphosphohydrolase
MDLIVLATRNAGKSRELIPLLAGLARRFATLREYPDVTLPEETGTTYAENALIKARAANKALSLPALGDDSGLEVDALSGLPGIRSARYAGDRATDGENNDRVLAALTTVPAERRTARYRCALALVLEPGHEVVVEGTCEGRIAVSPTGSGGFGYDPLFIPDGQERSFGEILDAVKNRISHRARAVEALRAAVAALSRD